MNKGSRYHAPPSDPREKRCEFCEKPAVMVRPIVDGKLYVYGCDEHRDQAVASVTGKRPTDRPRRSRTQEERLFDVNTLPKVE